MQRGFKAEAERLANLVRDEMGIGRYKPLDIDALVRHVGAQRRTADELTTLTKLHELEELQPGAFSACTFDFGSRKVIVVSPLASDERQRSDASHEASHLLLNHTVKEVEQLAGVSFFTCDPDEEQEATWLAGCLLLPRDLLVQSLKGGLDAVAIAEANTVSLQMANFRLRATGVERQAAKWRR
jgi:Zn-dependent peptidase ImmA (M78 family)